MKTLMKVGGIFDKVKGEFLELKFNFTAKDNLKMLDLLAFWAKYLPVYPPILSQVLRVLVMFGSTYLCETAFSARAAIKIKYRNKLDVEGDYGVCCLELKHILKI